MGRNVKTIKQENNSKLDDGMKKEGFLGTYMTICDKLHITWSVRQNKTEWK